MRTELTLDTFTDAFVMEEVRKLRVAYKLKTTLRYATTRDHSVHSESVAEHVFGRLCLAQYFLPLEDPEGGHENEVSSIILFHDFSEILHGDVPYHRKTPELEERERQAAEDVFAALPDALGRRGRTYWQLYDTRSVWSAQFVYALDKIEPLFELADPVNERSMKRLQFTYEQHIGKKLRATEDFPYMRRFVDAMTKEMIARDVFWTPPEDDGA